MLRVVNRTPFAAHGTLQTDRDGRELWVVIVKGTFLIGPSGCEPASQQEPVRLTDEYFGEPGRSSLRYASELAFDKPGTDVVVNGWARAPGGRAVTTLDVAVRVHRLRKSIRVFGDRLWERGLVGLTPGSPKAFVAMPLLYELAYGGTASDGRDAEGRNPIGRGFASAKAGQLVANLEDPTDPIRSDRSRPRPAGFGFVAPHWQPRLGHAGTYDQKWADEHAPLWPADFDPFFFQAAPQDMICQPSLRGGEPVELVNLSADGRLAFDLPRPRLTFRTCLGGEWLVHEARLGAVILEPDVPRVMMVWQTAVPCTRRRFDVAATVIGEKLVVAKGRPE